MQLNRRQIDLQQPHILQDQRIGAGLVHLPGELAGALDFVIAQDGVEGDENLGMEAVGIRGEALNVGHRVAGAVAGAELGAADIHGIGTVFDGLDADIGGTQRVRGSFGQALLLDGSSAGMELADTPLIHFGKEAFSLDFWLCPQGLAIDSPHPRRRLFDKGQWPDVWWNVDILSDGRIRMELGDGSGPGGTTESDTGLADHAWSHVAIVVDRDQRLTRTYVNGALVGAKALPAGFTTRFDTPGKAFTTGGWQPFQGLLDELRIYRRVLTPEEIRGRWEAMRSRYTQTDYQGDEE